MAPDLSEGETGAGAATVGLNRQRTTSASGKPDTQGDLFFDIKKKIFVGYPFA
jgi:hypothetical protein